MFTFKLLTATASIVITFSSSYIVYYIVCCNVPGLLMTPEHSETKAKTETRECEIETEIETKTKNLL